MTSQDTSFAKKYANGGMMVQADSFSGTPSSDENEAVRLRYKSGGRMDDPSVVDNYDRTGNMKVARTLSKYQTGGVMGGLPGLPDVLGYVRKLQDANARQPATGAGHQMEGYWDYLMEKAASGEDLSGSEMEFARTNLAPYRPGWYDWVQAKKQVQPTTYQAGFNDLQQMTPLSMTQGSTDAVSSGPTLEAPATTSGSVPLSHEYAPGIFGDYTRRNTTASATTGGATTPTVDPSVGWVNPTVQDEYQYHRVGRPELAGMAGPDDAEPMEAGLTPGQERQMDLAGRSWFGRARGNVGDWVKDHKMEIGAGIEGLVNILPNLLNIRAYNRLPQLRNPELERAIDMEVPSFEADRQAIKAQGRTMQNQAGFDTVQSGGQAATRARALAGTTSALSRLAGQEGRLTSAVRNQERWANQQSQARNIQRINQFYRDLDERDLFKVKGKAQERALISSGILSAVGNYNQRKLDKERMDLTRERYNMEKIMERAAQDFFNEHGYWPNFATQQQQQYG